MADKLADQTGPMFAFHTFAVVGAVLMRPVRRPACTDGCVPVAGDSHRRLRLVAFAGLVGTAVVAVIGSGLDTEFMLGIPAGRHDRRPSTRPCYNHWVGTIPWCWVLAGLAGLAGLPRRPCRRRAALHSRRIGLVLGGLTLLLLGISPFQYMAGMTGPLWLLVTAIGFTVGDRVFCAARMSTRPR